MPSKFLTKRVVLSIHRDQIEHFGGEPGVRDVGLLESALQQPQATYGGELLHSTVYDQAAAYLFHLAQNHPFVDGNKRVALAATDVFLRINGYVLTLSDADLYDIVIAAATGSADKTSIARKLRKGVREARPQS